MSVLRFGTLKQAGLMLLASMLCANAFAQSAVKETDSQMIEASSSRVVESIHYQALYQPDGTSQHRFWDTKNRVLFSAVAASAISDFTVTHANLQNGGQELNPVTRAFSGTTAGLALNFAGETAGVIGLSYYLHKTGHHRLERLAPLVSFGASAVAVTYGVSHR